MKKISNFADKSTLVLILLFFVVGAIHYITKDYAMAIFYAVITALFILMHILIEVRYIRASLSTFIEAFYAREFNNIKKEVLDLQKLQSEISKELNIAKEMARMNEETYNELTTKPVKKQAKKDLDKVVDEVLNSKEVDEVIDKIVEETLAAPKKRRGRPKKSDK